MSKRGKRGVSKCKKFNNPEKCTIEFDDKGLAIGENASPFMSWVGLEFKKRIPYHQVVRDIDKQLYNDIWEYIKVSWNIPNDDAKRTILKQGKAIMKNFRHSLVNKYAKQNKSPFEEYEYLDKSHWDSFVAKALSEEYEVISQKAKISAGKNVEPPRVGRMGFVGLMNSWEDRWNQLVSSYPNLADIQDQRLKIYAVSRAHYNPLTNLFELGPQHISEGVLTGRLLELYQKEIEMKADGTYYEPGKDVVTEVIGKGRQHGGRTRLDSYVIGSSVSLFPEKKRQKTKCVKRKTVEAEILTEEIDATQRDQDQIVTVAEASPGIRGSSCASGRSLPHIESISECELMWPFDESCPNLVLGSGWVYPSSDRILHGCQINNGFVKVDVHFVNENCKNFPVPPQTRTGEVNDMRDTQSQFIQWPRKSIKLLNTNSSQQSMIAQRHSVSLPASLSPHTAVQSPRTRFDERYMHQPQQTIALQSNRMSVSQGNILQKQPIEKTPNVTESDTRQPSVPLSPLTVAEKDTEGDTASVAPKRKRGRPRKLQALSPKTPVTEGTVEQSSPVLVTRNLDSEDAQFIRTMSLWKTIESMEAFRMFPQNPHFRPLLEGVKESAREGLAIGTMATFPSVVDKTCGLRFEEPRSTIEDCLDTLVDLENNGFVVEVIRERLTRLLLIKDKQDELAQRSKGVAEKIEEHTVQRKRRVDEEIKAIDRQIKELEEKRKQVVLNENWNSGVMEAMAEEIEQEMKGVGAEFDVLAAAPL